KGRELLPRRISSQIMDLGRAYPVYMVAGMATLIILPGSVTGIRTGNPEAIQYFRPDKPENEVTVVLQNQAAKPTNLILRSGKKIYVFDVVPSKNVHQDVLEVVGDYGGAGFVGFSGGHEERAELIDSSDSPKIPGSQNPKKAGGK
ncbi:hypothetical protein WDW37_17535, partial [Bdellovibrionota bacterium FG-1]